MQSIKRDSKPMSTGQLVARNSGYDTLALVYHNAALSPERNTRWGSL